MFQTPRTLEESYNNDPGALRDYHEALQRSNNQLPVEDQVQVPTLVQLTELVSQNSEIVASVFESKGRPDSFDNLVIGEAA